MIIRELHAIDEFRQVVELEHAIWGYTDSADTVTVPVFIITTHRGGILLGAYDETQRMVGFAFSIVGMKDGQPMQWSHMTGVLPDHRGGLGYRLKLAQRERALAQGYGLIEWTFDPLQAMNAHLNCSKLGAVAEAYAEDFYGPSTSALHRGTPTDRLIASWHIREPHVVRRLDGGPLRARSAHGAEAPIANPTVVAGRWRATASVDLAIDSRRLWIEIPTGFTDIQQQAPDLALEWRMRVREMFLAYFAQGYRVVDFALSRELGYGRYLLATRDDSEVGFLP
jgi:predicted GNAT superfamily acetyltransferase